MPGPSHGEFPRFPSIPLPIVIFDHLVWCWGWDGAGDLEGPDVDPIWERMANKSTREDSVVVRHDRSILL